MVCGTFLEMVWYMGVITLIGESMLGYFIKTIKEFLYSKKSILVFTISVFAIGAFALIAKTKEQKPLVMKSDIHIGIVDNDQSFYSSIVLNYFKNSESIAKFANITLDSQENMEELFNQGQLLAYLVIPQDFANSLMGVDFASIDVVINTSNVLNSVLLKNMLDSYGTYITNVQVVSGGLYHLGIKDGMSADARNKMNYDTSIELVKLALSREKFFQKNEVSDIPSTSILQYYLWAVLVLLIILTATLSGSRFLKERQLGTYERLRIAGHSIRSINLVILAVNSALWILCFNLLLPVLLNIVNGKALTELMIYVDLCIILANVCFWFISILCSNIQHYVILCTFGMMLISLIGGVLIPFLLLPERFLIYSRMTPTYYMIKNMIQFSNGTSTNKLPIFALSTLLVTIVLYWIACFILEHKKAEKKGEI